MPSKPKNCPPNHTRLLISVRSADEAVTALAGGADIIDIKEPREGVLGAAPLTITRSIVKKVAGQRPVSATVGDIPIETAYDAVLATAENGVDYVKIGAFGDMNRIDFSPFSHLTALNIRLILVLFADRTPNFEVIPRLRAEGFYGVMLDTAEKANGTVRTNLNDAVLATFLAEARRVNLMAGLAGSLRVTDIASLLPLQPDVLGFRGAACKAGQRRETLDPVALFTLRQQIPSVTDFADNHFVAET